MENEDFEKYNDLLELSKKNIVSFTKINFLFWPLSIVLIFINQFVHNDLLKIIIIFILILMLLKVFIIWHIIKKHYELLYPMGRYPVQRINTLVIYFINSAIISLSIYLLSVEKNSWLTIPLIIVSFFIFILPGAVFGTKEGG